MKKFRKIAFPLSLVCFFIFGCKTPALPVFGRLENLSVGKVERSQTVVTAVIQYYNPNDYQLTLKHIEAEFFLENKLVGSSVLDTTIFLPKRDSFLLPVSVKLNLADVLSNGLGALLMGEANVGVKGFARLGRNGIFIRLPIQYEGRQKIQL